MISKMNFLTILRIKGRTEFVDVTHINVFPSGTVSFCNFNEDGVSCNSFNSFGFG